MIFRLSMCWLMACSLAISCELVIEISGFRDSVGNGGAAVYRTAEGFPRDGQKAFRQGPAPIENGRSVVVFKDLPPGRYAVAALHDRNGNGKLDSNLLGIPKEGVAVTNHPGKMLRSPSFDSSTIACEGDRVVVPLMLQYW